MLGALEAQDHFKLNSHLSICRPQWVMGVWYAVLLENSFRTQLLRTEIFLCDTVVCFLAVPGGGYRSGFFWFTLAPRMWPLEGSRSWLCPGLCETKETQNPKVSYWQMTSKAWLPSLTSLRFCLVIHYKLVSSFQEDVFGQMLTRNFTPKDLCTKMLLGKLSIVHKNEV